MKMSNLSKQNCCVFGCSSSYKSALKQGVLVQFYSFPNAKKYWLKDRRLEWIHFARRTGNDGKHWKPAKNSKICSQHFVGGFKSEDPRSPSYNPSIFNPNEASSKTFEFKETRYYRKLKREERTTNLQTVLPDEFPNDNTVGILPNQSEPVVQKAKGVQTDESSMERDVQLLRFDLDSWNNQKGTLVSHHTFHKKKFLDAATGDDIKKPQFSGYFGLHSKEKLSDLTAVSGNVFALLISILPKRIMHSNESQLEDKLLLTLMKIKSNLSFSALAVIFGTSSSTACRIFDAMIDDLYAKTSTWLYFPSQEAVRETLPGTFKESYSSCRVIIDCTEMKTQTPPTVEQRIHMYSSYKGGYTAKYLIGVAPNGMITFLSNGYGGRATDTYITNNCGILDLLENGDTILADKGFPNINIQDGTVLVMPPFAKSGQAQFPASDMERTYEIASLRIHVERVIQRIKIFNILTSIIPVSMFSRLDKIVHLCCVLTNLSSPIIKDK